MSERKIKAALISVYYKDGLEPIVRKLNELGVQLISTGGTLSFIQSLNIPVTAVASLTGFPEILGGRVKTLHPKIFGGILGRRELKEDLAQMQQYEIAEIDLVIVDLYPFEETVSHEREQVLPKNEFLISSPLEKMPKADEAREDLGGAVIEKIDIGGISLIRAAAKNFNDVLICASRNYYPDLINLLNEKNGISVKEDRQLFAAKAFNITSHYDSAIFNYFSKGINNDEENVSAFKQSILQSRNLRYGENPHQRATFYGDFDALFTQLNGKEISYNNLVDIDSAVSLIDEFENPACAVIKHTNACGCAEADNALHAWELALAADPVSAFGGIIVFNRAVDLQTAEKVNEIFFEVIIAPDFSAEALAVFKQKKNRIILSQKSKVKSEKSNSKKIFRSILNGVIEQDADTALSSVATWKVVTAVAPSQNQIKDLLFAEKCIKHLKSNTIVLAKNKQLIGMGCGQTSRVDALKQAISKAKIFGFDLKGSAMASDAFFPFDDCVTIAHEEGIAAVIQPGGSVKDKDSVDACNKFNMAMVTTGLRHFLH
ncbi:MAG: bifunctional phosphoribosylaminoimidazolecarboxamide formyltransferase/IMP cyclohydrolase [Chitinophagales bacterium]|nr:bifunctional phosphoribosylaminoimidazolecarboxamide formyltransferase/IMP cyclohydrolase [Chitinophagales bacterium]